MDVPVAGRRASSSEVLLKVGDTASMGTPVGDDQRQRRAARPRRGRAAADAAAPRRDGRAGGRAPRRARTAAAGAGADARGRAAGARRTRPPSGEPGLRQPVGAARSRASSASTSRRVQGTGRKGRISTAPTCAAPPSARPAGAAAAAAGLGLDLPPWPKVDFAKYGEVERVPLSRIRKLSAATLARNWVHIPHVTHNDEADVTELEAFRKQLNAEQSDVKVTMVALLLKACAATLAAFPDFNSSLDGDELVRKRYYNLGFAADTPNGLVVPVVKDVDRKGLLELAGELTELSGKARAGQARARRDERRDVHDLEPRRHRRHVVHADRQRARGRDPRRRALGDEARSGTARSSCRA